MSLLSLLPRPGLLPKSVITINVDPVLQIGGLSIHWYGVCYAVAFWVGLRYGVVPFLGRQGVARATAEHICFWAIIVGLIGARLYYVVQSSPPQGGSWFQHPEEIFAVWHGGMAFFGAIFTVVPFASYLAWRHGINGWVMGDAIAIFGVLGQPIGRIGNVINGDILGHASSLPWATAYAHPNAVLQSGFCLSNRPIPAQTGGVSCAANTVYAYQPAAVYEMLGTIAIGVVLWLLLRRGVRAGTLILTYVELYSVSQVAIFFLRGTEPEVALGLKQGQWTALVVGLVAVPALVLLRQRGFFMWGGPAVAAAVPDVVEVGAPEVEVADVASDAAVPAPPRRRRPKRPPIMQPGEPADDPAAFERGEAADAGPAEPGPAPGPEAEPPPALEAAAGASSPARAPKRRSSSRAKVAK